MKKINKKVILSGDPGLQNYAFCITKYNKGKLKILKIGMIKQVINNLVRNDITKKIGPKRKRETITIKGNMYLTKRYIKRFSKLLDKYKPDEVVMERFQVRFRGGQSIAECVSFMLGCLATLCEFRNIPYTWLVASQWKNAINKEIDLEKTYSHIKDKYKIEPHMWDALCQGMYVANQQNLYTYKRLKREKNKVIKHFAEKVKGK